jgi:hypothetical protein
MDLPCEPNRVFVEPRWWRFSQRVLLARRIGDRVLVIFDYMEFPNGRPAQNLVAYDLHQQELWRAESPEGGGADAYVNFISESPLTAWNFACYACTIDPETGRLIEKQFTK